MEHKVKQNLWKIQFTRFCGMSFAHGPCWPELPASVSSLGCGRHFLNRLSSYPKAAGLAAQRESHPAKTTLGTARGYHTGLRPTDLRDCFLPPTSLRPQDSPQ